MVSAPSEVASDGDSGDWSELWLPKICCKNKSRFLKEAVGTTQDINSSLNWWCARNVRYRFCLGGLFSERKLRQWIGFNDLFLVSSHHLPFSSSLTHHQVLTLQGLGITVGENYALRWELAEELFDCHPEENVDQTKCRDRGCLWMVHMHTHTLFLFSFIKQPERKHQNLTHCAFCHYSANQRRKCSMVLLSQRQWVHGKKSNSNRCRHDSRYRSEQYVQEQWTARFARHQGTPCWDPLPQQWHATVQGVCLLLIAWNLSFQSLSLTILFSQHKHKYTNVYWHPPIPSPFRSGTQPQIVMRFRCRCRFLRSIRMTGFTRSVLLTILSGSRSSGKLQEPKCEYISWMISSRLSFPLF